MRVELITLNLGVKCFYFPALAVVPLPDSAFLFQKLQLFHFVVKSSIKPPSRGCKPDKICHGHELTVSRLNPQIHGAEQQSQDSLKKNWILLKPHILHCVTLSGGVQALKRLILTPEKMQKKI